MESHLLRKEDARHAALQHNALVVGLLLLPLEQENQAVHGPATHPIAQNHNMLIEQSRYLSAAKVEFSMSTSSSTCTPFTPICSISSVKTPACESRKSNNEDSIRQTLEPGSLSMVHQLISVTESPATTLH